MTRAHGVLKERVVIRGLGQYADAPLGEHGVAFVNRALGKHNHPHIARQVERGVQTRHATAGDYHIACHIFVCSLHRAAPFAAHVPSIIERRTRAYGRA